jgi:hypothetical protein
MVHLRIVAPEARAEEAMEALCGTDSVLNVIRLDARSQRPDGVVIMCDVAREDASVVIRDLKRLGIHHDGSIALELIDTAISDRAQRAEEHARGAPADAVVWEEVEAKTDEQVELSGVFLAFMVLAALIAAVGIYQDSPILIVGAMVVGPEFGPIAGICVALVQRRRRLALRSAVALALGFPLAIAATFAATLIFKATGLADADFDQSEHSIANVISSPGLLHVLRRRLRRRGRDAVAVDRQVGRPDRRADLGDDDPRGGQHRRDRGLRRLGELRRLGRAAGDQPRCDPARRLGGADLPAGALSAPSPAPRERARELSGCLASLSGCPGSTRCRPWCGSSRPRRR